MEQPSSAASRPLVATATQATPAFLPLLFQNRDKGGPWGAVLLHGPLTGKHHFRCLYGYSDYHLKLLTASTPSSVLATEWGLMFYVPGESTTLS